MKSLGELDPTGKKVVVRVDWNVTLGKALQVVDDTRIARTLPTLKRLLEGRVQQITILAHLGKCGEGKSLEQVARYAEKMWGEKINFYKTIDECKSDSNSRVRMLENLRMQPGEDNNDPEFAKVLASLGEVYVDEAFGEAHRESASIVGIPKLIPGYAGLNFEKEVDTLSQVIDKPARPLVVVMGGAKVEDKIKLLEVMSHKADTLLIGGKLANQFIRKGMKLGGDAKVVVPVDGIDKNLDVVAVDSVNSVDSVMNILDVGVKTQTLFAEEIKKAKTVVWNGPMGKVEEDEYRAGTHAVYEALSNNEPAMVVVGGGDTLAAIKDEKHLERIDFVSTGGGAMLKLMEKGTLPGIEVLG